MLINLSNHSIGIWLPEQQKSAREAYGELVDLPFPIVSPEADNLDIQRLAKEYLQKVQAIASPAEAAVHIMGEMTLTYALVTMLKKAGYTCLASTSIRDVYEQEQGKKIVYFKFVRFREY